MGAGGNAPLGGSVVGVACSAVGVPPSSLDKGCVAVDSCSASPLGGKSLEDGSGTIDSAVDVPAGGKFLDGGIGKSIEGGSGAVAAFNDSACLFWRCCMMRRL
jgi:hypothetical protein